MRRNQIPAVIAAFILICLSLAAPLMAASMGRSGGYDLDQLLERARQQYDLSTQDAIVLLEHRHIEMPAGGVIRTTVHRVVWVGSTRGVHDYADLRIPWNSATSSMTVKTLRTWRDDTWWPDATEVSSTAVVETLPFAVALADDYTAMRETMLLHDGVEVPCIMETAWTIEERTDGRGGFDGTFLFPQEDPALMSVLSITLPEGESLASESVNGAPDAAITKGTGGTITYTWSMDAVEPLGEPHISSPASYAPAVAWSTWSDWQTLGAAFVSAFDGAVQVQGTLADSLAARLEGSPGAMARARRVAALVNEWTRRIRYDTRFWTFSPRPAVRTYETAYGHDLDRAVLAAALFRLAGLGAEPLFYSEEYRGTGSEIPGISRFDRMMILVQADQHARFDPSSGALTEYSLPPYATSVWRPAQNWKAPQRVEPADGGYELHITLEPAGDSGWRGTGYLNTSGALCSYTEMVGLENEMQTRVETIAQSVLPGCTVDGCNPETLTPERAVIGFNFKIEKTEPDRFERTHLALGDPAGGINSNLPDDIHLYQENRTSPVVLPCTFNQTVTVRLKAGDRSIVSLPRAEEITNRTGRFTERVSREDGWITVERSLQLNRGVWDPASWPQMRELLLGNQRADGRTIVLE